MKKSTKFLRIRSLYQCLLISCSFLLSQFSILAQDGLVCNQAIQISLKENCQITVVADHILENTDRYVDYQIIVEDIKGNIIPDHIMTPDEVGKELTVTITHPNSKVSCWSTLFVDSKIFPEFHGCTDVIVPCSSYPDTLSHMDEPELVGSKCGAYTMSYEDHIEEYTCPENKYSQIIHRTWTMHNMSDYAYSCTQTIYVKQQGINDISFPHDYDGRHYPAISCDFTTYYGDSIGRLNQIEFLDSGFPSTKPYPYGTGSPGGEFCHNIKLKFEDTQFSTCGNESKILRKWHVIDWCTSESLVRDQIIKLEDDLAPILIHDDTPIYLNVNSEDCTGVIDTVPYPIDVYDCSPTHYELSYKIKDQSDSYEGLISEGLIRHEGGSYGFGGVPLDTIIMVYTVSDECGHTSQTHRTFILKDQQAPIAICEKNTVVTLSEGGYATIFADKLDHHSYDNCAIVDQKIKRENSHCDDYDEDEEFGDKVHFCCSDTDAENHKVIVRVFDAFGNFSDCHTQISIQDKVKPIINHCPEAITMHCDEDYHNTTLTNGKPDAHDNCGMTMDYIDDKSGMNACGIGDIVREWKVSDYHGNWETCIQHITMSDHDPVKEHHIKWPRNKVLSVCHYTEDHLSDTREPIINHKDCGNVGYNYKDQIFYDSEEACAKILRTWSVIDWCKYDPGSNVSEGYWTHVQQIKVNDETIPQLITGCEDVEVNTEIDACDALISLEVVAEDACTLSELKYAYSINLYNDEVQDSLYTGEGSTVSQRLPSGHHTLTYRVEDGCGNGTSCNIDINVTDELSINQICVAEIAVSLGVDGQVEIWAKDFIKDVSLSCGREATFEYSFSENANEVLKIINCNQFNQGEGVAYTDSLEVFAIADKGSHSSCQVMIKVTDNFNVCGENDSSSGFISGKIIDVSLNGIEDMMIHLKDMTQEKKQTIMTNSHGEFTFNQIDVESNYELLPEGYGEAVDGLSTLDIITLQQHILGKNKINSSYKLVAADVDGSKSITVSDLLHIRKVILGYSIDFPIKQHWTFINAAFEFADPEKPYFFPERISLTNLDHFSENISVISVKMGDVNGSVNKRISESRSNQIFRAVATDIENENLLELELYPENDMSVYGWQYGMSYDQNELEFLELSMSNGMIIPEENIMNADGKLFISMTFENEELLNTDQPVLTSTFRRLNKEKREVKEIISFNADAFQNELYNAEFRQVSIITEVADTKPKLIINQNTPNPFYESTNISLEIESEGMYMLSIYNAAGKYVFGKEYRLLKGSNLIELNISNVQANGLLICQINGSGISRTIKMYRISDGH